jgi:hypothetical protein
MKFWTLRGEYEELDPILKTLTAATYQRHISHLFDLAGLDGSSHSIRRMAAQWAARCGADIGIIRNVGRWQSLEHVYTYLAEGKQMHTLMIRDSSEGVDPIFAFWAFSFNTEVSAMESTGAQLLAMATVW